jgi:hypothetical protein
MSNIRVVARSLIFCVVLCRSFLSFVDHCVVCPLLTIVLSVLCWLLCCLSFVDHCVVCPLLTIVLSVLCWPLCCLSFVDHCVVCPLLTIVLSVLRFTVSVYTFGTFRLFVLLWRWCHLNDLLYCVLLLGWCVAWTISCILRYYSDGVWLERFIILLVTLLMVCDLNGSLYCSLLLWWCVAWTIHYTARYRSDGV